MPPFNVQQDRQEARGQQFGGRQNPYLPPGPSPLVFEQYKGINTNTTRPGVPDEQMYWCDGFMPLAPRNLRTLYGIGDVLFNAATLTTTVVFFTFVNIGETPYMIVVLADGRVVAINTNTSVVTTILVAGTITSPSIVSVGINQWGNEYAIIVADQPNGYWLWNGTLAFTSGGIAPAVEVVSNGAGYSSEPSIILTGGHGSGVTFSVSISSAGLLVGVSVTNPGTGYEATDSITASVLPAPTGGSGGSVTVTSLGTISSGPFIGMGTINAIGVNAVGTLYVNPTLTFVRVSTNAAATAAAVINNGTITSLNVTSRGLYNMTGSLATIYPTVVITDAGVSATVSVHLMPFGIQGTAVETYSGHVWVANGATVYYTAPGFVDDFSTSNGGGNFTSSDSHLKVRFTQLIAANGFLYLIGDSSVNYISGVQTSGTPPTTSFTQQDADAEVGSPYPQSVIAFGRNVLMANSYGVHTIKGGAVSKVSEMLDGVYATVAEFGGLQLASAQATIFGNRVWMVLVRLIDPVTEATVNKIVMWDGVDRWWSSSQEITLSYIKHQEIDSVITAYGTDGTVVHPLFQQPSGSLSKVVQSRLYDAPGGFLFRKAENRYWGMAEYYSTVASSILLSIDNETGTAVPYTLAGPASLGSIHIFAPQAVAQQGPLTGLTIQTSAADMAMIASLLQSEIIEFRG